MTTENRPEPNVTLGELLMLQKLSTFAYEELRPDPRSLLAQQRGHSSDLVSSSLGNIEQAFGKVEETGIEGQVSRPTATGRNIGDAAYLADYLILLARRQDVDQEKLRHLIADLFLTAEGKGDGGNWRTIHSIGHAHAANAWRSSISKRAPAS